MTTEKTVEAKKDSRTTESNVKKTKRRNYKKELEQAVAEKNELLEKLLRTAAEFDNYRKRVNNEKLAWIDNGKAELISSILPVLDDLERFASVDSENQDFEALHQGVVIILKNFKKALGDSGLVEMEPINEPFDPEKHDALIQMEREDLQPDIVIEQHQKGYEFKDQVLRHAKVVVSK